MKASVDEIDMRPRWSKEALWLHYSVVVDSFLRHISRRRTRRKVCLALPCKLLIVLNLLSRLQGC